MNASDIHHLTGAYAVDALPPEERDTFEQHLAACDACRTEVRELQATAAHLGAAGAEEPPAALKGAVMDQIRRTPQVPPVGQPEGGPTVYGGGATTHAGTRSADPRWYERMLAPAAAVLVLVVIGLTAVIANLNARLDDLETLAVPVAEVFTAPDSIVVSAEGPGDASMRLIASPTRGEGVFLVGGMEQAPSARVYQLWLLRDGQAVPAGLLDIDERGRGAQVMTGDMSDVDAVALTIEPDGGSPQPTSAPISVLVLPEA